MVQLHRSPAPARPDPASPVPPSPTDPLASLIASYRPAAGSQDEMLAPDGSLRPHWHTLASHLASLQPAHWNSRTAAIQRLLLDHGVTYNIYDDSKGASRPWALDPIPFILSAEEWQSVAAGLSQRSRLLNAILADLYGPQHLLREGWLPPVLVHANPGFLRAAWGVNPPGDAILVSSGTDLVRGPDGSWLVLADRTQAPSGRGYAFENRSIIAEVFGETLESCRVQRLGSFFHAERDALRLLAPTRRGSPGVVLMTPGPYNETYFEHAYEARLMGYPLVEGADLTVRDRKLFLKTLEGLRRVDVLLRRVDDVFADPLELRADTFLGVSGLSEAWRSGNVSLVNGIGSGVVESPALHPFLPGICRHLLGEELMLGSVPAWWCGQPRELSLVLDNPSRWVLKPAFASGSRDPVFLDELSSKDLNNLLARVRAEPHAWIAQEALNLSTTPVWNGRQLEPRPLVWRAFSVSAAGVCTVMPGGLSRVSPVPGRFVVTMQRGSISKDTWVLDSNSSSPPPDPPPSPIVLRPLRSPVGVPSRAAEHLFWLGRYAERMEWHVRLVRTTLQRFSGESSPSKERERLACLRLLSGLELAPPTTTAASLRSELHALLSKPERTGSIPDLASRLRYNAAAARDRLSDDSWRLFNRLERDAAQSRAAASDPTAAAGLLDTLILDLAAFAGMQQENMTRGHGWRFLESGRRLERAINVLSLVRFASQLCASDNAALSPLLEVCDSTMTYRRLHFASPALLPTADLLLLNEENPRAAAAQFQRLSRVFAEFPAGTSGSAGRERELLDALRSDLASLNLDALRHSTDVATTLLPSFCSRITDGCEAISAALTEHFFSHAHRRDV
jgi:uncharacterized circularly permuted ATP-grasp superfamily protein/uncharacterized alpha-E superfamily protein